MPRSTESGRPEFQRPSSARRRTTDLPGSVGPRTAADASGSWSPAPAIDPAIEANDVPRRVRQELRTLTKENAAVVGGHLVMVWRLLDSDLAEARAHADAAIRRAGRVAVVRETRGIVAYREGDWQLALSELRTARRLSGTPDLLPLIVDVERALGRPDRALEMATSEEAQRLGPAERVELAIVVSGIRRDRGQADAAAVALRGPYLDPARREPWSARLFYAYAEALLAADDRQAAREWFAHAADADEAMETDAVERLDDFDGVVFLDAFDEEDPADEGTAGAVPEVSPEPTEAPAPVLTGQESADAADQHGQSTGPGDPEEPTGAGDPEEPTGQVETAR